MSDLPYDIRSVDYLPEGTTFLICPPDDAPPKFEGEETGHYLRRLGKWLVENNRGAVAKDVQFPEEEQS